MSIRIERGVERGGAVTIRVDGVAVTAFAGETVAAAMLGADRLAMRRDTRGAVRGLFCNMGTCSECFVTVRIGDAPSRRLRACLLPAEHGMIVETGND